MPDFLRGTLIHNRPGAEYEGAVYDRRLVLELPGGREVRVFDPYQPVGGDLLVGATYTVVVSALLPHDAVYFAGARADAPEACWHGVVRDT